MESLQTSNENSRIKIVRPPNRLPAEEEISEDGLAVSETEYWEKNITELLNL